MTKQVWNVCDVSQKDVVFPRDKWGESSWPTALREKRVVYSNTPSKNIPQGHVKILRHISMPLIHLGEAIGLLQIANKKTDYTQEDLEILGALGETIATTVMNENGKKPRLPFEIASTSSKIQ
jgi:hypothetical protein